MHSLNMMGLGALAEVLTSGTTLSVGNQYAFTFDTNKLINLIADTDVKVRLQYFMQNFGDIVYLNRPFFSGRYVIVVVPKASYTLTDWLTAFNYAWSNMPGFEQVTYDMAETGSTSSMPGGLPGLVIGAGEMVGQTAAATLGATLGPLTPYLLIGGVIILGVTILPTLLAPSLASRPGLRRRNYVRR